MATLRDEIQKRVDKKKAEVGQLFEQMASLDVQIREANSYIQALEDTLKLLPKDSGSDAPDVPAQVLRPGSTVAKARDAILAAGKPLHINDILNVLGKGTDNASRAAVSGSIAAYVRKGEIFTRPAPNTFGLIGLKGTSTTQTEKTSTLNPPAGFGVEPGMSPPDADSLGGIGNSDDDVPF